MFKIIYFFSQTTIEIELWNGQKLGIISSWGFSVNEHKLNGCFDRGKLLSGMRSKDKAFQQNFLVNTSYQKIDEILARQCSTGLEPQHSKWRAGETVPSSRSTPPTEQNSKTKETQNAKSCHLSQHGRLWGAQCDISWGSNEAAHRSWGDGSHQGREEMRRCWSGTTLQWDGKEVLSATVRQMTNQ